MPLKKYNKKLNYSYTYGVFPTLDLFKHKKDRIRRIVLNTKGAKNEGYKDIENLAKQYKIPLEYNTKAIMSISEKENTYAIGVFDKYQSKLTDAENHVVLVNPTNTGNLGTIIRTMLGFDVKNLAMIRPTLDIFEPKVIRSSMGSFFAINFEYFDHFQNYMEKYGEGRNIYPFMTQGAENINAIKFSKPFSLIFGNESQGLPNKFKDIGQSIYIPHSKEIDSLNISMAVGLGLYLSTQE
jgi:RNA methyltransferase, TrmH family